MHIAGQCPYCGSSSSERGPRKGVRQSIHPNLPGEVRDWLRAEADRCGVTVSAFVADVFCVVVGRNDLIREVSLDELYSIRTSTLPTGLFTDQAAATRGPAAGSSSIRIPIECWKALDDYAQSVADLLEQSQPKRRGPRSRPTNLLAAHILETVMQHGIQPLHDGILLTEIVDHGGQEVLPMVG